MNYEGFVFSRDKTLLSITRIGELLSNSYWASSRSKERIALSIQHSLCFGIYKDGYQVGFARAVSDYATMFWLADVIIDESYRKRGLGKKLVEYILDTEELQDLAGILATKDAHGLYMQYGYLVDEGHFMRRTAR